MASNPLRVVRSLKTTSGRIRVMVVDDSVVIRHLLTKVLGEDNSLEIVGSACNGEAALAMIPQLRPDVITLDIEMPVMDGLETLRHIRREHPGLRTIMFSTLTLRGASATFEALALGADDYVAKPANAGSLDRSVAALRMELIPKIRQFFGPAPAAVLAPVPSPGPALLQPSRRRHFRVLAVGVSTGGPQALGVLIPSFPANLPLPVVVVQHMPTMFTRLLAERLDATSKLLVVEATNGMEIVPGQVLIARGDFHLQVHRTGSSFVAALDQGPPENSCRPAVDVLFRSLAEAYGDGVLSVVLTGMGSDGLRGTRELKRAGCYSLVQDQSSSVVWGMPGAIAQAGLADRVLPLDQMASEIIRLASA